MTDTWRPNAQSLTQANAFVGTKVLAYRHVFCSGLVTSARKRYDKAELRSRRAAVAAEAAAAAVAKMEEKLLDRLRVRRAGEKKVKKEKQEIKENKTKKKETTSAPTTTRTADPSGANRLSEGMDIIFA